MKNKLFVLLILLSQMLNFSQEIKTDSIANKTPNAQSKIDFDALIVIDGKILTKEAVEIIDTKNVKDASVLKSKAATDRFSEKGKNGVILIKTNLEINNSDSKKLQLISGIVSDKTGVLPGAEVRIKGTKIKTTTDFDGKYSIIASEGEVLIFRCVGMIAQEITLDGCNKLNVTLNIDQNEPIIMVKKPIIYLYPKTETKISLKINFKGTLQTTFPKYDNSWEVIAKPNGHIFDVKTKRNYSSLFWDGIQNLPAEHYNYKNGFVMEKANLATFLIEKLEYIGLNTNETNEFVQFWLPIMEKNNFNLVHFLINDDYNYISENIIYPKPDTSLRIFMEFAKVEKNFKIKPQKISKTNRKGFTLVEWGGADVTEMFTGMAKSEAF